MKLQMVDLKGQYEKIKAEIDHAILHTVASSAFINGPQVHNFAGNLADYLSVKHVIPCANGTDALQIALMALELQPGDEVIVPAFTYVATAEVIALLGLTPIMVDVDADHYNLTPELFEEAITEKTKAVVPVHLFGQGADMDKIVQIARDRGIFVVEDNAQAIGADYYREGEKQKLGTLSDFGTTSFFPAKNLGCFGDGGAIFTNDEKLAERAQMIANHGQTKRYYHGRIGVNSRLDSIQAAVLDVKLKYLDDYAEARQQAAAYYDKAFGEVEGLKIPRRVNWSSHVFHQYTMRVTNGERDELREHLNTHSIPHNVYYPVPLYEQEAFKHLKGNIEYLPVTDMLCKQVISLPIHTEMTEDIQKHIVEAVLSYFK